MTPYTYQDLLAVGESEKERMDFCIQAIQRHTASEPYKTALIAREYDKQKNVTITQYQKLLYTISGQAVPDNYSANHKCASNFFHRFVLQQNQYLLSNGIAFEDESVKEALGGDKFDIQLKKAGREALIAGVSFGFFNLNSVTVFKLEEFAPLIDEEDGAYKAGIRFWQVAPEKPLRFTLYEMDGYTEYIRRQGEAPEVLKEKRPYIITVQTEGTEEGEIIAGRNYPSFPIVPLWPNSNHQSMIVGMRENIDCYDLIKSGFANDLDDASMLLEDDDMFDDSISAELDDYDNDSDF